MSFPSDYSNHHPVNPISPPRGDVGERGLQQPKQETSYQEHTYSIPTNLETSIKGNSAFQECDNEFAKQVITPQPALDNQAVNITDIVNSETDISEEEDFFDDDTYDFKGALSQIYTKESQELKKIEEGEEIENFGKEVESTGEEVEASGEEKKAEAINEQKIFIDKVSRNYSNVLDENGNSIFNETAIESQFKDVSSTNSTELTHQLFDILTEGRTLYKRDEEGNLVPMTPEEIKELRERFTKDVTEYFQNKFPPLPTPPQQTQKEEEAEVKPTTFKLFDLSKDIKDKQDAVSETPPKFGKDGEGVDTARSVNLIFLLLLGELIRQYAIAAEKRDESIEEKRLDTLKRIKTMFLNKEIINQGILSYEILKNEVNLQTLKISTERFPFKMLVNINKIERIIDALDNNRVLRDKLQNWLGITEFRSAA